MAVRYSLHDGELVSIQWARVLEDMAKDVDFNVNEGHRTIARQQYFWNCGPSGCCCCNSCNLAAFPSNSAPHIRKGRADHAIDFSNDAAVFAWLEAKGLNPVRTVPGESWHIEASAAALASYQPSRPDPIEQLPKHVEVAVRKLLYHRKQALAEAESGCGPRCRKHIRWRKHWRGVVERLARRTRKPKVAALLRQVLRDRDGEL